MDALAGRQLVEVLIARRLGPGHRALLRPADQRVDVDLGVFHELRTREKRRDLTPAAARPSPAGDRPERGSVDG